MSTTTITPKTAAEVAALVARAAALTDDEITRLVAAWADGWGPERARARYAAWDPTVEIAWQQAKVAAWDATKGGTWGGSPAVSRYLARDAAWGAVRDAVKALIMWDLATEAGPFRIVDRDLLLAPWVEVCGAVTR